jgi:oligopeptide/dipeptide ABC transporter ATP-binding protein
MALLSVETLTMEFPREGAPARALDGVSFTVERGRVLGLVGESGCGKSMTALCVMRLVPPPGRITAGRVMFDGVDLLALPERAMRDVRGARIAMIFQEPMTALNPVLTAGYQIAEGLRIHRPISARAAWARAVELLAEVGIPEPASRAHDYPHQLSGGMRQRVMIASAIACEPDLLIADEPTTALDVTIQAEILDLLRSMPTLGTHHERLETIPGNVPDITRRPSGCSFRDRCPLATPECGVEPPPFVEKRPDHRVACIHV